MLTLVDAHGNRTALQGGDVVWWDLDGHTLCIMRSNQSRGNQLYWMENDQKDNKRLLPFELNELEASELMEIITAVCGLEMERVEDLPGGDPRFVLCQPKKG